MDFGLEARKNREKLLYYGRRSFRSWEVGYLDIMINGYLLEPLTYEYQGKKVENNHPLLVSVLGAKKQGEIFIHDLNEGLSLRFAKTWDEINPENKNKPLHKSKGVQVSPWFNADPQLRKGGLIFERSPLEGTLWWQTLAYRKDLLKVVDENDILKAYLIGVDEADADLGFPRLLQESCVPYLPEWLEILTTEIKRRPEWTTKLIGHQMTGYAVRIPKEDLFGLVQNLARDSKLPLPEYITNPTVAPAAENVDVDAEEFI